MSPLAATIRTALVVGERDGRDKEIMLSPTTVGDITVFPIDSAADHLGNLLGGADPTWSTLTWCSPSTCSQRRSTNAATPSPAGRP
jgi:hypothetical protein